MTIKPLILNYILIGGGGGKLTITPSVFKCHSDVIGYLGIDTDYRVAFSFSNLLAIGHHPYICRLESYEV